MDLILEICFLIYIFHYTLCWNPGGSVLSTLDTQYVSCESKAIYICRWKSLGQSTPPNIRRQKQSALERLKRNDNWPSSACSELYVALARQPCIGVCVCAGDNVLKTGQARAHSFSHTFASQRGKVAMSRKLWKSTKKALQKVLQKMP